MKKIIGIVSVLLCLTITKAQELVVPVVDERTELLSIVFRLAGAEEYVTNDLEKYVNEIDSFFISHKNHDVIKHAQDVRSMYGVSYDAVMSIAVHIDIVNQEIRLKENIKKEGIDNRWMEDDITEFVQLLNSFYNESDFHRFFVQHKDFYQTAETNMSKVLENVDFGWFEKFYGEKNKGTFHLVISLVNGPSSYGANVSYMNKSEEDIYAIIGTWATDDFGEPTYSQHIVGTVIHEFNHSFCNPLIEKYYPQLEKKASEFYALVHEKLAQQAYGSSKTMLCEILVRACVIKYYQSLSDSPMRTKSLISNELGNGFLWIEELVNSLSIYEKSREKYPTLESYMPEIVKLQNSLSPKKLYKKLEKNMPVITGTNIANGAQDVDPSITEIVVKFSSPMYTGANGASYGKKGEEYFPEVSGAKWNSNQMEWVLTVSLEPDTEYSISFPSGFFYSSSFYNPKETYFLDFKTGSTKK